VNEGFARLTGYTTEEVLGKTPGELNLWVEREPHRTTLQKLEADARSREKSSDSDKVGEIRYGRVSAVRVALNGKQCMLSVTHDITYQNTAKRRYLN